MGTAATLTNCSKDETQEVLDTMIAPKITLTFDKDKVEAKEAKLIIRKLQYDKPKGEAFVDLNGNLKKDVGEELKSGKEYTVTTESVSILGESIQKLYLNPRYSLKAEVTHRNIKSFLIKDQLLESVVVTNAQSLENLNLSTDADNSLKELVLPDDKQKIANLKELNIAKCFQLPRADVFNRLPDRTGKDPKGKVKFLSSDKELSEKEKDILDGLNWEADFGK